jgi:hypothetical protein
VARILQWADGLRSPQEEESATLDGGGVGGLRHPRRPSSEGWLLALLAQCERCAGEPGAQDIQGPGILQAVWDSDTGSMGAKPSIVAQEVPCEGFCGQEGQADYKDAGRTAAHCGGVEGG